MNTKPKTNICAWLICASISLIMAVSCVSKEDLEGVLGRLDAIENIQIASINAQISSISNSDQQYNLIHQAALRNEILWPDWFHSDGTYESKINQMRESFIIQLEWMNEKIAKF